MVIIVYLVNGKLLKEVVISVKVFVVFVIKNGWKMNDFVGFVDYGVYNCIEYIDVEVIEV